MPTLPSDPAPRRSDMVASVALPLAVIVLGIAVQIGLDGGVAALVDLCLTPFR